MKGLLLKELYFIKNNPMSIIFEIILIFLAITSADESIATLNIYLALYSLLIVYLSVAYDEKNKWDMYSMTLSCSISHLVSVKYLLGLSSIVITFLVSGIFKIFTAPAFDILFILTFAQGLTLLAFILPFIFILGATKGYLIGIISAFPIAFLFFFTNDMLTKNYLLISVIANIILSVVLYAVSWFISIRFYKKF